MTPTYPGRPAMRIAVDFLRPCLTEHSPTPGSRIGPARTLAAAAGVSYMTMCRALREMKNAGVLTMTGGRIYRIAGSPAPSTDHAPVPAIPRATRRNAAAQAIADDIVKGVYRQGKPLPSLRELQGRYRVAYRTIRKSLSQLVAGSVLEQRPGGRMGVPSLDAGAYKARILCLVPSIDSHSSVFGQHSEQVFRDFELVCAQANVEIDLLFVYLDEHTQRYRFRHKRTGRISDREDLHRFFDESVLGSVYVYTMMGSPVDAQADEIALAGCLRQKRPVCLFDENDRLSLPRRLTSSPDFRRYTAAASPDQGREVGRRLLALGHRRVAFISTYPVFRWSQVRLEGLQSVFTDAGFPEGVVPFVAEWREWHEAGARRANMTALREFYAGWRKEVPEICRGEFDQVFEKLRFDASVAAEMQVALRPLLEQALADPHITAWIMVNDFLSAMALPFLKENRIRIPVDLSLVSFDDSEVALRNDFSSYNFNHRAIAEAMLGFILKRRPFCDPEARVPGFITDRGTIGMVRK